MSTQQSMNRRSGSSRRVRGVMPLLACAAVAIASACAPADRAAPASQTDQSTATGPSIVGSYQLVSRELPDGSTLMPPDIFGWMTFTTDNRLVDFYIDGPDGRYSTSLVAIYSLSSTVYDETSLYRVVNDEARGAGPSYQLSTSNRTAAVTLGSGTVEFHDTGENAPLLVFSADGMTATAPDAFVDHWTKVN